MSAERNRPRNIFKSIRKTVWKTRKRIRKTIRNAFETFLAPLRPTKTFSLPIFHQILKVFHRPKFAQKKFFFHREALQGGATLSYENSFFFVSANRIALRIAGPSKYLMPSSLLFEISLPFFCRTAQIHQTTKILLVNYLIFFSLLFPWKLKPGFINRVLVAVIFEASKRL